MSAGSCSESGWDSQDDRWDDWEGDEMDAPAQCLFCPQLFQSPPDLFSHARAVHGFDFLKTRSDLALDFYQSMRVVNYIRTRALDCPGFEKASGFAIDGSEPFLSDDAYLKPAIPDDSLLFALDELDLGDSDSAAAASAPANPPASEGRYPAGFERERELMARIQSLEQQLGQRDREIGSMAAQFEEYRQMVRHQFYDSADAAAEDDSAAKDGGDMYFSSYAGNEIHAQMLQDRVRTDGYRDFILGNQDLFKGKVVLDVGCGTGILSMFAAKAGAAKVIAVDNSDIIHKARANVIENGLDDVITLVRGKIEEVELPVGQVDVIISEWMGYFLLFEAMLDSVLVARDRYLAPGGLLAPSASYLYLTAMSDDDYLKHTANFWDCVYGFKMSAMKPSHTVKDVDVAEVSTDSIVASRALLTAIDHGTTEPSALDFSSPFVLRATRDADIHAFVGYFDVAFSRSQVAPGPSHDDLCLPAHDGDDSRNSATPKALWSQPDSSMGGFTTGPHGTTTHWKQAIFLLTTPISAKKDDEVRGEFTCRKSAAGSRELDMEITYLHAPAGGAAGSTVSIKYKLGV
ncbi:hypothetical protein LPJ61_000565 [Coemansia biformis]|uniref:type I protein arginine methyltransferase n=1 Tax=Coemansia biformis TaxID=1286918 RepID=A0A9W8D0E7_9FUNG|nr:hypothetical protein LPJ61_000565 [Coemansia biformis]